MKKLRCRIICIITLVVVTFGSILNPALSLCAHATGGLVEGALLGDLLIELAVALGISYVGDQLNDATGNLLDRNSDAFQERLFDFCCTTEGYNALIDLEIKPADGSKSISIAERFGLDHMGSNQSPDPRKVEEILAVVLTGLNVAGVTYLISRFYARETASSSDSAIGAAINEASSQEVTYGPFPSNWHFSSIDDPVYSLNSVDLFSSSYPEFSLEGNSFVEIYNPYMSDCFVILPCQENYFIGFGWNSYGGFINFNRDADNRIASYIFARYLQTGELDMLYQPDSSVFYNDNTSEVYMCGCIRFAYDNDTYMLNPDGSIDRVLDGQPAQKVIPHVITSEGYLTSVKPIVKMDISALVDAIGQAIADAHPDEVPSLSPEAVAAILSGVAGVYDDAVTNYYNDTSYIDQSQYITNITNVYEQAISDDPVIDLPATDTGVLSAIKAIPLQIANVLKDIFVPDIALYSFYFLDIKSKFAFADNFLDYGSNLITILFDSDPEIPKIVIDFGLAESKYNYGGRTYALDMTFYDRFKPLVDNIIVSFSWLAFGYWMYKNLPEIISGTILSRKDYAVVKETANTVFSKGGTFGSFSKERVKEIRDIDKIKIEKNNKK